jgi:hypothetical protein
VERLLLYLRNCRGYVSNDGQEWSITPEWASGNKTLNNDIPAFEAERERMNVLRSVDVQSDPLLGDIHGRLVEMSGSVFHSNPETGWNEERYVLIALRDSLHEEDLVTNDQGGHYQSWGLTEAGMERLSGRSD